MTTPKQYTAIVAFPQWVIDCFIHLESTVLHLKNGQNINSKMVDKQGLKITVGNALSALCKYDYYEDDKTAWNAYWLTNIQEVGADKAAEPETFGWLVAMRLFSEGVEIEVRYPSEWWKLDADPGCVCFDKERRYRRKPVPSPVYGGTKVCDHCRKVDCACPSPVTPSQHFWKMWTDYANNKK